MGRLMLHLLARLLLLFIHFSIFIFVFLTSASIVILVFVVYCLREDLGGHWKDRCKRIAHFGWS
jgi:hypothetical protein